MTRRINYSQSRRSHLFLIVLGSCLIALSQPVIAAVPVPLKAIKHLFTIKGEKNEPLSLPSDVAVSDDGHIYIVDSGNHRIAVFDRDGDHVLNISGSDTRTPTARELSRMPAPVMEFSLML